MYYIKNGLKKHYWLALRLLHSHSATFGIGSALRMLIHDRHLRSGDGGAQRVFDDGGGCTGKLINLILGILVALFVMIVLLGGIKRLARVTELAGSVHWRRCTS